MLEQNNIDYYVRRAEAERTLAENAADPGVARLHREMAERYDAIVAGKSDTSLKIAR